MSAEMFGVPCESWDCDHYIPLYAERCGSCGCHQRQWNDRLSVVCPNCERQISTHYDTCHCGEPLSRWDAVIQVLTNYEPRQDFAVAKQGITHPEMIEESRESIGLDLTPDANYRLKLKNTQSGLHIKEYQNIYAVHLDEFDPQNNLIAHWVNDAPVPTALAVVGGLAYLSGTNT